MFARSAPAGERASPPGPLYAAAAGGFAILASVLVLLGWALDVHFLKAVLPGAAAMKPNTAVALLLLGTAVTALAAPYPPHVPSPARLALGRVCASISLLIGAITLVEYAFDVSLGIDALLFPNALNAIPGTHPGRISQASSICLVLLGISALQLDARSEARRRFAQWPALIAAVIAFIAVLGYVYNAEQLYRIRPYSSVALHTAIILVLLGAALVLIRPDRSIVREIFSQHDGGLAARKLIPLAILMPVSVGWLRLQGQRAGWYDTEMGLALFAAANVITFTVMIWLAARLLNRVDEDRRGADFRRLHTVREAETRWRALVEASAQIVWTAGPNGESHDSPSLRAFTGQTAEQFAVDGMSKIVHPEDVDRMNATWQRAIASRSPFESEFRMLHADREWRWVSVRAIPIEPTAESNVAWVGMNYDIHEKKYAETLANGQKHVLELIARGAALEDTLSALTRVIEAQSPEMLCSILLLDAEGKRLRHGAAPSLPVEYTNVIDGTIIGPAVGSCGTAAFRKSAVYVEDIAVDPLWQDYKHLALTHGLRACWSTPIVDPKGSVLGTFAIYYSRPCLPTERHLRLIDLATHTAAICISRHTHMQQLRDSEARFRQLAESMPQLVWTCAPDGTCDYLNQQWLEYTGDGNDQPTSWLNRLEPSDREAVAEAWRASVASGTPFRSEFRLRRHDGVYRWFDTRAVPLRDDSGTIVKWIGSNTDIDDRKRFEETQLRSQKLESLGTLAGGIAHDFNNMLLVIQGNAQLAQDLLEKTDPAQEHLIEISQAGERASDLVRRILSFSRPQKAKHKGIEIAPVVEEALRLTRAAIPAMVEIRSRLALQTPIVAADATQIHQVVINLVTNAAHAVGSRAGGLIEVELEPATLGSASEESPATGPKLPPGAYVRLTVRDNGAGISHEHLERIFDPFFTTKPVGQGTGLGLSIVHGIMNSSGGTVTVESEPGKGSAFHLYFPVAAQAGFGDAPGSAQGQKRGSGQHVLFIDDEDSIVRLGTLNLTRLGYRVTGCTSPIAALKEFRRDPKAFDAVVTDLSMPGLSGFDCAREMLAIRPDLPILLTSGYMRPEDEAEARAIGIRAVSNKPTALSELGRTLAQIIERVPSEA